VVGRVSTDVSEEHIASIFRVEEISSAKKQLASRWKQNNPPAGKPVYAANRMYVEDWNSVPTGSSV
jgi:hypothetical protein